MLRKAKTLALYSGKSRSEFIVAPILLACRELCGDSFHIYSGVNLEADASRGQYGECNFILAKTPAGPALHSPLAVLVEAKKNDVQEGIGQCVAQMYGARIFNERDQNPRLNIFGCVTIGKSGSFCGSKTKMCLAMPTVITSKISAKFWRFLKQSLTLNKNR